MCEFYSWCELMIFYSHPLLLKISYLVSRNVFAEETIRCCVKLFLTQRFCLIYLVSRNILDPTLNNLIYFYQRGNWECCVDICKTWNSIRTLAHRLRLISKNNIYWYGCKLTRNARIIFQVLCIIISWLSPNIQFVMSNISRKIFIVFSKNWSFFSISLTWTFDVLARPRRDCTCFGP